MNVKEKSLIARYPSHGIPYMTISRASINVTRNGYTETSSAHEYLCII